MSGLPSGTVTFLFTDIEGSTRLLRRLGRRGSFRTRSPLPPNGAMGVGSDRDAKELVERAIPIARGLDDPSLWMMVHGNFGLAALLTGGTDGARYAFREELKVCRDLVVRPFAAGGLSGLAAVAAARRDDDRAARLAGAAGACHYGQRYAAVEDRLDAAFF